MTRRWAHRVPAAMVGLCLVGIAAACGADDSDAGEGHGDEVSVSSDAPAWLVERSGDGTTTFQVSVLSYNLSGRNLGLPARIKFADGDETFEEFFEPDNGLGPEFNAVGCTSCHVNNGRHGTPIADGWLGIGPVVHVSAPGAAADEYPLPLEGYGTRLQTEALEGDREARVDIRWEEIPGTYPDGATYSLRKPIVSVTGRDGLLSPDAEISLRIPPPVAGPGLLDSVPTELVVGLADPEDADGDGISGRAQWVPEGDQLLLGRHGWKAENHDLIHQSAGALAEDMGLGTSLIPVAGDIEITDEELDDLAFYVEGLAIPAGRDIEDPDVIAGANLFDTIGCSSCHTPQLTTGEATTPELGNLVIYPFTDLLLHDLGPGLDDGRPVLSASGAEWRTSALWGVGLAEVVNGHVALLHDGRARSVEEAILWHGGEADAVVTGFRDLSAQQRAQLIRFVESR